MRTISAASLAKLATKFATEPINILEVAWTEGGSRIPYADRDLAGGIQGKIHSIGELDAVINVSGGGQSQSIQVTLDDTDGSIKAILDSNDVHKRPCYLYQWFEGIALADKFLIFQGQVSSPTTWNESDRTVSFTIVSKLEDREIGFSAEEGAFTSIPEGLVGQPWPMIFGTALHVPTLAISEALIGTITSGAAIHDFTIPLQIEVLLTQKTYAGIISAIFRDLAEEALENGDQSSYDDYTARQLEADQRAGELTFQIGTLSTELNKQLAEEKPTITILGGDKFPQNKSIQLDIDGGLFAGYFTGTTFHITARQHPQFGKIETPFVDIIIVTRIPASGPRELIAYREEYTGEQAGFFFAEAGSRVKLSGSEPIDNIVSIVPGTVKSVAAKRNFEGVKRLVTVPPSLYTVSTKTFGSISAVVIRLPKPLSSLEGEGWEDDLYVTFQSSIGPNTVNILEYLIGLYMPELTTDATSFNSVRTSLANYPSNFALLERKNVVQVLEEIARQARCAIWLSGDKFYLRYLATEPTPTISITQSDIVPKTMQVFHTNTEDLVTKLVAEWREHYAMEEPAQVILKHNVKKYGTHERVEQFYIYNTEELVIKSATFWLIRMANTWKKMRFRTMLSKLQLETLDPVTLSFSQNYVSSGSITAIIEQANYDSASNEIDFEVWTPVKAGTMIPYDLSWPADVDITTIFPTVEEEFAGYAGGDGPGNDATGDLGGGTVIAIDGYREHQDYGDPNPSDAGDTAPPLPPIVDTSVFNLTNPNLVTPGFQTNPYAPGITDSVIDIRTTVVTDSVTGETSRLASFFKQIKDNKLQMDAAAMVSDGTNQAAIDLKYDGVNSPNRFAAGRAYLKE